MCFSILQVLIVLRLVFLLTFQQQVIKVEVNLNFKHKIVKIWSVRIFFA